MITKIRGCRRSSWLSFALILSTTAHIRVSAKDSSAYFNFADVHFQQQVTGSVMSSTGPLAGVTVHVVGGATTSTDADGRFDIAAKLGDVLVFTHIGYQKKEVKVTGTVVAVTLEDDYAALAEVVVVGYGTQKKESLTGALQVVHGDQLRDVTSPAVENLLNGKAAGVYVAPGTGQPGARGGVVIRGQATLSGTTSPLWVIDGVIVGSSAGDINPDDIASLTVLKDAASTAIYGLQGANGVVLVTTKRPVAQKMLLSYSSKIGFNELNNGHLKMMNGAELYDYYASFANANTIQFPRWNEDLRNSNFDWWKVATTKGFIQNHNLSIQGGSEQLQSYMSLGYYNELGAVKGYEFDRYNFRLHTDYKPYAWLSIKPAIVASRRAVADRQYSTTAMYANLPWDNPYDDVGNLVPHRSSSWVNSASTNYLYDLQWNHAAETNYELMGNMDFDIKLTDWLSFSSVNNYRYNTYASNSYADPRSNAGESVMGRLTDYRTAYTRRYTNHTLNLNKTWDKHTLSGLAAYEFNDYTSKVLDVAGTGFIPGFEVLNVVSLPERTRGSINEWAVQSMFSKLNYSYDGKYMAELSLRRDGASNFGDNAKYGNFFSISGGWNINKEEWFKADFVDALKLRASYGSVGNRPSDLYPQYNLYSVSQTSGYNGVSGALISQIGNNDLTWERTFTTGVGVDAALFHNRARISADYYLKNTDNILYQVPISGLVGVTSIWKNIGRMRNQGIEISLGGDLIQTADWLWSLDVNMGHNKNELTELYETRAASGNFVTNAIIIGDNLGVAGSANRVLVPGFPVDTYYMPIWAGVNSENGAPMWYSIVTDANGVEHQEASSNYAQADLQKAGKASPDIFGGIRTAVRYKRFDLSALFGYALGGKIYNYSRQEYDSDGTYTDRNQMVLQDGWSRWEKPGDVATHPIARYNNQDKGNSASTRYLEDADFLKLRSLTLGYTFNLEQYKIKNLRIFFAGENLFTWTSYSGVDPEISIHPDSGAIMSSAGPAVYPSTRKFIFGLNVSF